MDQMKCKLTPPREGNIHDTAYNPLTPSFVDTTAHPLSTITFFLYGILLALCILAKRCAVVGTHRRFKHVPSKNRSCSIDYFSEL